MIADGSDASRRVGMHAAAHPAAERCDSSGQQEPAACLLHPAAGRVVLPRELCHAGCALWTAIRRTHHASIAFIGHEPCHLCCPSPWYDVHEYLCDFHLTMTIMMALECQDRMTYRFGLCLLDASLSSLQSSVPYHPEDPRASACVVAWLDHSCEWTMQLPSRRKLALLCSMSSLDSPLAALAFRMLGKALMLRAGFSMM